MKKCLIILSLVLCIAANGQDSVLVFHELSPKPGIPRGDFSAFVIDSDLYVIGGQDSLGYYTDAVWKYHVSNDSWIQLSNFPGGAEITAGGFSVNRKGYICGGLAQNTAYYRSVWEYIPLTDTWTQKSDYPGQSLQPSASFSYNHKAYLGFGYNGPCNDLWEYETTTDQWTLLDTLPSTGRYGSSPVVLDSFAYFFGGYYRYIYGHACHETWRFNLNSNYWEQLSDMPGTDRGWSATWSIKNSLVCALGSHADSTLEFQTDKYIFNTQNNIWRPVLFQNFWDSIGAGYSFMIGNTGYYFGGVRQIDPYFFYTNRLFSFDAAALLTTGMSETKAEVNINVFPNPVSVLGTLTVTAPEDGEIRFTDGIGRLLYTTYLHSGPNTIPCNEFQVQEGIVFYSAQLRHGIANGKVVIVK